MNSNVQAVIDALACFKTNQHECLKCSYNPHAGMPWPYGCIAGQRNIIDDVIALLKAQEPVEPLRVRKDTKWEQRIERFCGSCGGSFYGLRLNFCPWCGRAVKWK